MAQLYRRVVELCRQLHAGSAAAHNIHPDQRIRMGIVLQGA